MTDAAGRFRAGTLAGARSYRATVYRDANPFNRLRLLPAGRGFPEVPVKDADTEVTGVRLVVDRTDGGIAGKVVDEDGAPIVDAVVGVARDGLTMADLALNWSPVARTVTGADGRFTVRGLSKGRYIVVAKPAPAEPRMMAVPDVATGTRGVKLVVPGDGEIVGRVEGFTGPVKVSATDALRARHEGKTDATGAFRIPSIRHGAATVTAFAATAGAPQLDFAQVDVTTSRPADVVLRPRSTYRLDVVVLETDGTPARDGRCDLALGALGFWNTGEEGKVELDVPAGLELRFRCLTRENATVVTTLPADAPAGVPVEMTLRSK